MQLLQSLTNLDDVRRALCLASFYDFVKEFWYEIIPDAPVWANHIEYLCNEMQVIVMRAALLKEEQKGGKFKITKPREISPHDTIINIPPGTTKSTIVTVMLPAWAWAIDPTLRIMTASYSQGLSTDHAVRSRDVIRSAKYQRLFPHVVMKGDQDNKTHYKNTKGGERYASSVTGTLTGFHAHLIIVDDPLNAAQAASDVELIKASNFMNVSLSTRKVDKEKTPTILVMQRLHQDDPSGDWLKKQKLGEMAINHICLPATLTANVKPESAKAIYTGQYLDPVRLSQRALDNMKTKLGSYGYAGQFDQDPAPAAGGIWQKWFIPVPDDVFPAPDQLEDYGSDWDLAFTENEMNAASAHVTSGRKGTDMFIDKIDWVYKEFPELITWMKLQPAPHYIEAKASGKSAKQVLVKQGINAIEIDVTGGDKVARARMATPYAQAGRVYIRASLLDKLYNDSEQGILKFPNNSKKDLADALAQAIQRIFNGNDFFIM